MANGRVGKVEDVLSMGDVVKVQCQADLEDGQDFPRSPRDARCPEGAPAPREKRGGRDRDKGGKHEGRGERDVRPGRANRTPRRRHDVQ